MYLRGLRGWFYIFSTFFFLEASGWDSGWGDCCVCVFCVWKEAGEKQCESGQRRLWNNLWVYGGMR